MNALRIVTADADPSVLEAYREWLPSLGHTIAAAAQSREELLAACKSLEPDLVVTDSAIAGMTSEPDALGLWRQMPIPLILVAAHVHDSLIAFAQSSPVMALLVKPLKKEDLGPAIAIAIRRFGEFQELRRDMSDLRDALQARKLIERAKGIAMKHTGLDEQKAFEHLQQMARQARRSLVDIADMVITAEAAGMGPKRKE